MTQQTVAKQLVWSVSKVLRIEQGTIPVAPTDVRALLHLYRISDESRVVELVELASDIREERSEWSYYSDILQPSRIELYGNEPAARVIYKYEPSRIPGLFQTREYARSLASVLNNSDEWNDERRLGYSQERPIERLLEINAQRQSLLNNSVRPELNFIIGEAALIRPVGGEKVMHEQAEHLLELAKVEDISVLLLPFFAGVHKGMDSPFTILQFANPQLSDLVYLEGPEHASIGYEDESYIRRYLDIFEELRDLAARSGPIEDHVKRILREGLG
jgi:hypothetical protein